MESQQVVDYISSQLKAGHSEATLRAHLVQHGWSESSVEDAFKRYRTTQKSAPTQEKRRDATIPRRGSREGLHRKSKLKAVVGLVVVVVLATGIFTIFHRQTTKPTIPAVHTPTLSQRQSLDVVTLGGAVGQYVATNNKTLPAHVSSAPDGTNSVVLCGAICDPATWQVSSLSAYKPAGVKMVAYSAGLTAPDVNTLYLVSGARCNAQGTELSTQNVKALSMSIVYATQENGSLQQHCVIL